VRLACLGQGSWNYRGHIRLLRRLFDHSNLRRFKARVDT
jgi:hypothetical protein